MDLSHWDCVLLFTRDEAACLMAGVDPHSSARGPNAEARVLLYRRQIGEAFENAQRHACSEISKLDAPPEVIAPDIFEFFDNELPTLKLRNGLSEGLRTLSVLAVLQLDRDENDDFSEDHERGFQRDDIREWISARGVKSVYRFDYSDHSFCPDVPENEVQATDARRRHVEAQRRGAQTKARDTLLLIVGALCQELQISEKRGAAVRIAEAVERTGATVTEDIIRGVLKEIPDAIERRTK